MDTRTGVHGRKASEDAVERHLAFPAEMIIEAASRCNYLCPLCLWTRNHNHGYLTPDTFAPFINQVKGHLRRVCFAGRGEPTLNPDLYRILRHSVEAGVITDLATNGANLSRDIDQVLDSGIDAVNVSIEADNADDCRLYRVGGDFDGVIAGIRRLADEKRRRGITKPVLRTCSVIFKFNEQRLTDLKRFFAELGVEEFIFKSAHLGHGLLPWKMEELEERWLPDNVAKRRPRYDGSSQTRLCAFLPKAHLLWNGDVCRCAIEQAGSVAGNIRDVSFAEIWLGETSRKIVQAIVENRPVKCVDCAFSGRHITEAGSERYVI